MKCKKEWEKASFLGLAVDFRKGKNWAFEPLNRISFLPLSDWVWKLWAWLEGFVGGWGGGKGVGTIEERRTFYIVGRVPPHRRVECVASVPLGRRVVIYSVDVGKCACVAVIPPTSSGKCLSRSAGGVGYPLRRCAITPYIFVGVQVVRVVSTTSSGSGYWLVVG